MGPYRFSLSGGLPQGTAFNNGVLSGTPTTAGAFTFRVTITDSTGAKASTAKGVIAAVVPPPRPPAQSVAAGAPGSWTRYATSSPSGTEAEYQSWYNLVYDTKRNLVYGMNWMGVLAAFNPVTGTWSSLTPNIGGGVRDGVAAQFGGALAA